MRFNASVIDNPKSSAYITAILLTLPGSKRYKFCDVICVSVMKVYGQAEITVHLLKLKILKC